MRVYFDNASTTPLLEEVKDRMCSVIKENYGNPSSIHQFGRQSRIIVEDARSLIAKGLNASSSEIFFTSGATESNNMVLFCSIRDLGIQRIISSPIEHHCILHTLDQIEKQGLAKVEYLAVDNRGHIDYSQLEQMLSADDSKTLVSLMHANNEIGSMHDLERISEICKNHNSLFHCDTAQTIGKIAFDLNELNISFLSGSAHKFFGPKGVGFIYINQDNLIRPMMHGGDQERGMRSGTENIYGIAGMAEAFRLSLEEMDIRKARISELREYCINRLKEEYEDVRINGSETSYLYNILSVSFPESPKNEMLMMNLDIAGICASGGSACSSGVENDTHVLSHINHDPKRKTVRFSFSHFNTKEEVDYLIEKLKDLVPRK